MKTAISVPDELFRRVEARVAELGVSRSEFYATAARRYLDVLESAELTRDIDEAIRRGAGVGVQTDGIARLRELTEDDEW